MKKSIVLAVFFAVSYVHPQLPAKVILCGVCRDVEARLPYSIKIMEKIGALFEDYRVIVYENNSSDTTPAVLKKWAQENARVTALSEKVSKQELEKIVINRLENQEFYRPELIARARNIVLKKAMSDHYRDFAYLIWMDLDFKLEPNYEAFKEVFTTSQEWDAVFAYGVDPAATYWDWYAFRDERCPIGSELLGNYWWYLPKKLVLGKKSAWYPVISAFGGCGIYKKAAIQDCCYSAVVTKDLAQLSYKLLRTYAHTAEVQKYLADTQHLSKTVTIQRCSSQLPNITAPDTGIIAADVDDSLAWKMSSFVYKYPSVCEHVTFHASMIMHGHDKLFINPRLLFYYGDRYP